MFWWSWSERDRVKLEGAKVTSWIVRWKHSPRANCVPKGCLPSLEDHHLPMHWSIVLRDGKKALTHEQRKRNPYPSLIKLFLITIGVRGRKGGRLDSSTLPLPLIKTSCYQGRYRHTVSTMELDILNPEKHHPVNQLLCNSTYIHICNPLHFYVILWMIILLWNEPWWDQKKRGGFTCHSLKFGKVSICSQSMRFPFTKKYCEMLIAVNTREGYVLAVLQSIMGMLQLHPLQICLLYPVQLKQA